MKVIIDNRIRQKVEEYQKQNGCTKTWIANSLGITTQWLYLLFDKNNIDVVMLSKLAYLLKCSSEDLFKVFVE